MFTKAKAAQWASGKKRARPLLASMLVVTVGMVHSGQKYLYYTFFSKF